MVNIKKFFVFVLLFIGLFSVSLSVVYAADGLTITSYDDIVSSTGLANISRNATGGYDVTFHDGATLKTIYKIGLPEVINTKFEKIVTTTYQITIVDDFKEVALLVGLIADVEGQPNDLCKIDLVRNVYVVESTITVVQDKVVYVEAYDMYYGFFQFDKNLDQIKSITLEYFEETGFWFFGFVKTGEKKVTKTITPESRYYDLGIGSTAEDVYYLIYYFATGEQRSPYLVEVNTISVSGDNDYPWRVQLTDSNCGVRLGSVLLLRMRYVYEAVEYDSRVIDTPTDPEDSIFHPGDSVFSEGLVKGAFDFFGLGGFYDWLAKNFQSGITIIVVLVLILIFYFFIKIFKWIGGLFRKKDYSY